MSRAQLAVVAFVAILGSSVQARADSDSEPGMVWGITATELLAGGAVVLEGLVLPEPKFEMRYGILLTAGLVGGIAIGVAGQVDDWDVRVPRAVHGAMWTGAALALYGMAIDGAIAGGDELSIGAATWTMASVGLLAGALYGALVTEEDLWWLALPPASFMAGIASLAIIVVGSFMTGNDSPDGSIWMGITVGTTTAVGTGVAYALQHEW